MKNAFYLFLFSACFALAGCDNGAKAREEIHQQLDVANKELDARLLATMLETVELIEGRAARLHAEVDLAEGGSLYEIKNAPCGATVYVDSHRAGTVFGCERSVRFGQTTVSESSYLVSIPPKKNGSSYVLSVKKNGFKAFQQEVKPQEKHGFVEVDATMQKM